MLHNQHFLLFQQCKANKVQRETNNIFQHVSVKSHCQEAASDSNISNSRASKDQCQQVLQGYVHLDTYSNSSIQIQLYQCPQMKFHTVSRVFSYQSDMPICTNISLFLQTRVYKAFKQSSRISSLEPNMSSLLQDLAYLIMLMNKGESLISILFAIKSSASLLSALLLLLVVTLIEPYLKSYFIFFFFSYISFHRR